MDYNSFKNTNNKLRHSRNVDKYRIITKDYHPVSVNDECVTIAGIKRSMYIRIEDLVSYVVNGKLCLSNPSALINWNFNKPKESKIAGISSYTGKKLLDYCKNFLINISNERDFVFPAYSYLKERKNNRVLALSGLRGTGKTVGILQIINRIADYNNCVYITFNPSTIMNYKELVPYIEKNFSDKMYIFIDEITFLKGFVEGCADLYDILSMKGKRILISGTDSYALVCVAGSSLYHRVILRNVTYISYKEMLRTTSSINTFLDYIKYGGLYDNDRIYNVSKLRTYIGTSVIDNIMNTINKNMSYNPSILSGIKNMTEGKIKLIIYQILIAIVYSIPKKLKSFNANFVIELFKKNSSYLRSDVVNILSDELGIDNTLRVSGNEVTGVLKILESIGLIVKIDNLCACNSKYYLSNPSIFNTLLNLLLRAMASTGFIKSNKTVRNVLGTLFESSIMVNTYKTLTETGYEVNFYHDINDGSEIDLVISKEGLIGSNDKRLFFEIKLSENVNDAVARAIWLRDEKICEEDDIKGRFIIYGGNSKEVFTKFGDKSYPPKGKDNSWLKDFEKKMKGVNLIPVNDFVLHLDNYIELLNE